MRAPERLLPLIVWSGLLGCGDDPPPASSAPEDARAAPGAEPTDDPLLRRAREAVRDGTLPPELHDEVLGSTDPAHARARRVLEAMRDPPPEPVPAEDGPELTTPMVPPATDAPPVEADGGTTPRTSPPSTPPKPTRRTADVGRVSLKKSKKGATLIIAAPSSLLVGVANQPSSGIVRLVIESARASGSVLTSRPEIEGARVTAVRQGQGTIQITLKLDPGWTFGSVQPFSGGAKVHLRAPG